MSINIHPTNNFLYFSNYLCYSKRKRLHSVCLARCIQFIVPGPEDTVLNTNVTALFIHC